MLAIQSIVRDSNAFSLNGNMRGARAAPHYGLPSDTIDILRCVPDQDPLGSDLNWCNVRLVRSKATGWVRSDFIIFSGDGY